MDRNISRKHQIALRNRVSVNVAALANMIDNSSLSRKPTIMVCQGQGLTLMVDRINQVYFKYIAGPMIARAYVRATNTSRTLSETDRDALVMGELMASWCVDDQTVPSIARTRVSLMASLKSQVLPESSIKQAYNHILMVAKDASRSLETITRDDFAQLLNINVDDTWPAVISKQKLDVWSLNGQALNSALLPENQRTIYNSIVNLSDEPFVIPDDFMEFTPNLIAQADWSNFGDDEILAFYEILSARDNKSQQSMLMASLLVSLSVLAKSGNVTDQWLNSRSEALAKAYPGLEIEPLVSTEVVQKFRDYYRIDNWNVDNFYNYLIAVYSIWKSGSDSPLTWVIEQAAGHNITSAVAFAEAMTKTVFVNLDNLMMVLGDGQFKHIAYLAASIQYDRFGSLVKPPRTIQHYADLAYIGAFILNNSISGRDNKYKSGAENYLTKTKAELEKIAVIITTASSRLIEGMMSTETTLRQLYPNRNIQIDMDGNAYIVPEITNQEAADRLAIPGLPHEEIEERLMRERADWARNFRTLPQGTERLTPSQVLVRLKERQSAKSNAFLACCQVLVNAVKQTELATIIESKITAEQRRRALPQSILDNLATLNVDPEPEWIVNPPPVTPEDLKHIENSVFEAKARPLHINNVVEVQARAAED